MAKLNLLEKEEVKKELQPHPLSFMNLHSLWLFLFIWGIFLGWLFHSSYWNKLPNIEFLKLSSSVLVWFLGMLIFGVAASVLMIRWRILFAYIFAFASGVALLWLGNLWSYAEVFIPIYTIAISFIGLFFVELYRRSHKYFITNLRIIFRGGIIIKRERSLRYDKITDLECSQGIFGKLFRYGTIIPISQSGFGLGGDASFAAGGVGGTTKKVGLFGVAGGEKEVQVPRTRSYYELHGVHPFNEVKTLIEELVQEGTLAPYQKEQVELQREMVDILKRQFDREEEK